MKFNCSYSELVDPKSVIPLSENPNTHPKEQIKSLAEIIKYQGQRLPIIIDIEKGDCVAGNGRLEAIRDVLKWDKIAVDYQKFENEDQRKAFIISENAISEWAHLDLGMINTQLADFDPSFDIDLLGIKDFVLEPMEKFEPLADEDDVPDVAHPITRKGDIWLLGNHRLMCGDSTMIDDVERLMGGVYPDLIHTDPPYGMNAVSKSSVLKKNYGTDIHGDDNPDIAKSAFGLIYGLYPNAKQIWWGANYYCSALPDSECWLVWDKNNGQSDQTDCELAWANFRSVVRQFTQASEKTNRVHPTQKPVSLTEWIIKRFKLSASSVADFFGGSGSTLIAAEKNNIKSFLMEYDEKFVDVIIQRWEKYTGKKATLELTGQTYEELKKERGQA